MHRPHREAVVLHQPTFPRIVEFKWFSSRLPTRLLTWSSGCPLRTGTANSSASAMADSPDRFKVERTRCPKRFVSDTRLPAPTLVIKNKVEHGPLAIPKS